MNKTASKTSMLRLTPEQHEEIKAHAAIKGAKMATIMRMWVLDRLRDETRKLKALDNPTAN